jgi:hypothetical protein
MLTSCQPEQKYVFFGEFSERAVSSVGVGGSSGYILSAVRSLVNWLAAKSGSEGY